MLQKILLILVLAAVVAGGFLWKAGVLFPVSGQVSGDVAERRNSNVKVIAEPVVFLENNRVFEAVGTGRAKFSADIYPAVSEEVTGVFFESQQHVKKGDVLVQLDDRQEKLALRLAEVELKDAKSLLNRYERAAKEGAVPESEVDAARAAFESAEVAFDKAKLDLEERQISAPFDGVVGIPNADVGDRVDENTLITGLDARDILYVDFEVPEGLADALKNAQADAQPITAVTPSYPNRIFAGHIVAQETRLNIHRRTIMARASINNEDDALRPGMSFTTKWEIAGDTYAAVPEIAVQWGRDGAYVWLVRDGKAVKVMTDVMARKAGRVYLSGAIQADEIIVVEGVQRLRDGIAVDVLNGNEVAQ
ncbi:MAG: efflux transporter periplasmic adaptor subunit [Alphaproteobacteria bacterium]|nr:efflux transporter periplasmic adaptor subunit [Alphaproteobacteria bacterium]|tara:strand:- start:608 stop:1699 length:1092 start_codon:yes stop_codon:yes gene_type:complete